MSRLLLVLFVSSSGSCGFSIMAVNSKEKRRAIVQFGFDGNNISPICRCEFVISLCDKDGGKEHIGFDRI